MPYCTGDSTNLCRGLKTCNTDCKLYRKQRPVDPVTGHPFRGSNVEMLLRPCAHTKVCKDPCDHPFECKLAGLSREDFWKTVRQKAWSDAHPVAWCVNPDGRCNRQRRIGYHYKCQFFRRELCDVDRMKNIL